MRRRSVRRALKLGALALALLIGVLIGSAGQDQEDGAAAKGPTRAELVRVQQAADEQTEQRYQAGLADARASFEPGAAGYRRIYSKGVRTGRKQMTGKLELRYQAGVKAGKAKAQERYEAGHSDGWDEGYDVGYEDGYDVGFDDGLYGDNDTSGSSGGGEDLPDVGYDLDCADFDGPVHVSPSDPHGLDADGDGVGCE